MKYSKVKILNKPFPFIKYRFLGDYNFFYEMEFHKYFQSRFKLHLKHLRVIQALFILTGFGLISIQAFVSLKQFFLLICIECVLVFLFIKSLYYIIHIQFQNYKINTQITGFFVLNELSIILETTKSLKDATKFIIAGSYPLYSLIFEEALIKSHLGNPLKKTLLVEISKKLSGEVRTYFLNIIQTWERSERIIEISRSNLINKIEEQIVKEMEELNTWSSLSSGLTFLSPPVILCFLLLSNTFSLLSGLILFLFLIISSVFIHPDRHVSILSLKNHLLYSEDNLGFDFLILLSENLSKGNSFYRSLYNSINTYIESNVTLSSKKRQEILKLRVYTKDISEKGIEKFQSIFPKRIVKLISLSAKFSLLDSKIAGERLFFLCSELRKPIDLIIQGRMRLKASSFQEKVIQLLSLLVLGFISGAAPFFLFISSFLSKQLHETELIIQNALYDFLFIGYGLFMSFIPYNIQNLEYSKILTAIPSKVLLMGLKFILFLGIFLFTRIFYLNLI